MLKIPYGITIHFIICVLISSVCVAQEGGPLSVEQAVSTGLANSRSLHASVMKTEYAGARASEAKAVRLPSLKLSGGYARLSDVPPFRAAIPENALGPGFPPEEKSFLISQTILNNYNFRLTLQQPVFTGFRLKRGAEAAVYSEESAVQDYRQEKSDLVYDIKSAYWNYYRSMEFMKVIDENVAQMKAHLHDVRNFFEHGNVTKNEVLKVEVQLSNAELLRIEGSNNVRLALIRLNSVMGLPLEVRHLLTSTPRPSANKYESAEILVRKALASRPEVKSMEYRIKSGESAVAAARSGWYPQIFLSGNYYYSRPNQRFIPALDKFKETWDIGISATMDIWNWGTTIHQVDQAEAQLAQLEDGIAQLRDGIALEVTQNYFNLNQSVERIAVAEKGVGQADENYRITSDKFKSGLALNSELIDAEVALLQAKFSRIQSLIDCELADARLRKSAGMDE